MKRWPEWFENVRRFISPVIKPDNSRNAIITITIIVKSVSCLRATCIMLRLSSSGWQAYLQVRSCKNLTWFRNKLYLANVSKDRARDIIEMLARILLKCRYLRVFYRSRILAAARISHFHRSCTSVSPTPARIWITSSLFTSPLQRRWRFCSSPRSSHPMHFIGRDTRDASLTKSQKSRIWHAKAGSIARAPYECIYARECHLRNNVLSNKTRLPPPLPQSTCFCLSSTYRRLSMEKKRRGEGERERWMSFRANFRAQLDILIVYTPWS